MILCTFSVFGQSWTQNISSENPTFFDIQNAFNEYWTPYDVKDGKYLKDGVLRKAPGWKQFKRWEYHWEQRVGPSGEFPANTVDCDAWQEYKNKQDQGAPRSGGGNWTSLGPSTNSTGGIGRVNCIAFHPTNANTFWVGTPAGGLWKTTNGGNSWTTNTDDLPVLGVSSIAIHPTNPNIMYIATGDGDAAISLSAFGQTNSGDTKSIGILKSTDGGNNWTNVLSADQLDGILVRKLLLDPAFPDYLHAVTSIGIFSTSDAGQNWTQSLSGYFMDIEFHPNNTDVVYASSFDPNGNAQVFVSTDVGASWTQTTSLTGVNRIEIEVTPAAPDNIDILCSDASNDGLHSLYYSTNSGSSWALYWNGGPGANLLGWYGDASDANGQGSYDLAFAIDPNNYGNILVGGVNLWRTTDGGTNWFISNMWIDDPFYNSPPNVQVAHADKHDLVFHPFQANTIFDCNDGGVYKSTDGGASWSDISNGLVISQMYSISNSQTYDDLIAAGLQDNGAIGYDQGSWVELSGGDGMMCHIDPTDPNFIYTAYVNGVIYRYDLSGPTQTTISENLPGGQQQGEWLTPYQLDPNNPMTIYAGYEGLYKSTNRGNSWSLLSTPAPGSKINYLRVAPSNSNYIYVGFMSGIFRSTNGGSSWTNVTGALPVSSVNISGFSIDPSDENTVLVTMSGYSAANKVFLTTNGGNSWSNSTLSGLPNLPVNCSEINATNGDVYLGTDAGIFEYDLGTNNWVSFSNGLPNAVVTDLDIQYSSALLRAGTFGRGLWETTIPTSVGVVEASNSSRLSLYPNPNNGSFVLQLNNMIEAMQSVDIINSSGQTIQTFEANKGFEHKIEIDGKDLTPGIYVVTVRTNKSALHQRFVVER